MASMAGMAQVTVFLDRPDGVRLTVAGTAGRSLMRAAQAAGVAGIAADCGGVLSCATCHVVVAPDWALRLPPPGPDELAMLEMTAAPREATSRLSCQIVLGAELQGLVARLPDTQY
jgi:2Fe-2S ferredoxin